MRGLLVKNTACPPWAKKVCSQPRTNHWMSCLRESSEKADLNPFLAVIVLLTESVSQLQGGCTQLWASPALLDSHQGTCVRWWDATSTRGGEPGFAQHPGLVQQPFLWLHGVPHGNHWPQVTQSHRRSCKSICCNKSRQLYLFYGSMQWVWVSNPKHSLSFLLKAGREKSQFLCLQGVINKQPLEKIPETVFWNKWHD